MDVVTVSELPGNIAERIKNLSAGETITFVSPEGIPEGFFVSVHGLQSQSISSKSESIRTRNRVQRQIASEWFDELERFASELGKVWPNGMSASDVIADVRE